MCPTASVWRQLCHRYECHQLSSWDHDMTTYATTYGWRSVGVRSGLMTSPLEQNPINGGQRGSMGPLTLSLRTEKVAGSSPAERTRRKPCKSRSFATVYRVNSYKHR